MFQFNAVAIELKRVIINVSVQVFFYNVWIVVDVFLDIIFRS